MNKDIKYLVFGMCVAFVLLGAFAGVSVGGGVCKWHVKEWESVGSNSAPEEEWDRAFGGSDFETIQAAIDDTDTQSIDVLGEAVS